MSYIINNSRGQIVAVIPDGVTNTSATDLALIGQAVTNFGTFQNENYLYLLENFANGTAPNIPILGQLWYNANTDVLHAYDSANTWTALASQTYVDGALTASFISPSFSGTPTAPTATLGTNSTQIATTSFVNQSIGNFSGNINNATLVGANISAATISNTTITTSTLSGVSLTGNSVAVTAANGTSTTQVATTAFVLNQLGGGGGGNITTGNVLISGQVSAAGNVTGNYILGNGSQLTGVVTSVSNISLGTSTAKVDSTNGNVSVNIAGVANIGLFTSSGLTVGGNITADNVSYSGNIVSNGVGTPTVTSTTNLDLEAPVAVRVTGGGTFRLPTLTQTQINALTPSAGDMVYNTTVNKMQVYQYATSASTLSWVTVTESRYQ